MVARGQGRGTATGRGPRGAVPPPCPVLSWRRRDAHLVRPAERAAPSGPGRTCPRPSVIKRQCRFGYRKHVSPEAVPGLRERGAGTWEFSIASAQFSGSLKLLLKKKKSVLIFKSNEQLMKKKTLLSLEPVSSIEINILPLTLIRERWGGLFPGWFGALP